MSLAPETIQRRMADFETSGAADRIERHAQLAVLARSHYVPALPEKHAKIEAIGPWEAKAFEMISRGVDPGKAALAFVDQFIANAYGDVTRGAPL